MSECLECWMSARVMGECQSAVRVSECRASVS